MAWSVLAAQLKKEHPEWSLTGISFVFSLCILAFAFTTLSAGFLQRRFSLRQLAVSGAVAIAVAAVLGGASPSLRILWVFYGIGTGIGMGIVFSAPLSAVMTCFPSRAGLAGGVVMGAFGSGGLIFSPLTAFLVQKTGNAHLSIMFLGVINACVITIAAQALPAKHNLFKKGEDACRDIDGMSPLEVLRSPKFYISWVTFMLAWISGLALLCNAQVITQAIASVPESDAAKIIGLLSVFNTLGSPLFGALTDRLGAKGALKIQALFSAIGLYGLSQCDGLMAYFCFASVVMLCYGGLFGILPAFVKGTFGSKHFGSNYGLFYIGYGISAVVGPLLMSRIVEMNQNLPAHAAFAPTVWAYGLKAGFRYSFSLAAIVCVLVFSHTFFLPFSGEKPYS